MVQANSILIVSEPFDAHADRMVRLLRTLGHEPIRFHPADIPLQCGVTLRVDKAHWRGKLELRRNGRSIDIEKIGSIWWRRPQSPEMAPELSEREQKFAREEIAHAMRGIWATRDCYWVSYPHCLRLADLKPLQLQRAVEYGFEIPRTLITNNPEEVLAFYEECHHQMIYKVLTDPSLEQSSESFESTIDPNSIPKATYTTLITREQLSFIETVKTSLCLFQEYIPKQYELRVTVIGDELFAAEIHSQAHERTSIDWRHYDVSIPYRKATLPVDVVERCMAFVKSYQLNFSTMDLIVTPDGRYVFIENNPNGQFLFVQQAVPELKMAEALAACLIRGANG
jgi:glutathione synthase/RimK-type ligase-like ATP-grasp enzyme